MVSCEGNTATVESAALDCGSEDGEPARNIEHAQARRGIKLAGMNLECARWGRASATPAPGLGTRGWGLASSHSRYPVIKEFRYALFAYLSFVSPPDSH